MFASLYDELVNAYTYVANEVDQFIPSKKSKEYIKSFKTEMDKVVEGTRSTTKPNFYSS